MVAVDRLVPRRDAGVAGRVQAGPEVRQAQVATSFPLPSTQALPSGSVTISLCSWLIVEIVGSAVLELGRGLFDWQWSPTAL